MAVCARPRQHRPSTTRARLAGPDRGGRVPNCTSSRRRMMCTVSYDGDYASAWSERRIARAKKRHTCASCAVNIMPGRSYWRRTFVSDGVGGDEACCDDCWSIAEAFGEEHRLTPLPSSLLEYVEECALSLIHI